MTHVNNIPQETINRYAPLFNRVWQAIGPDMETAMEECGEVLTAEMIGECCYDANRLLEHGAPYWMSDEDKIAAEALADEFYALPFEQKQEIATVIGNYWA